MYLSEKHSQSTRYIQQLESDLDIAREQNRQLREELHIHQTQVFKLEADGVGQSVRIHSCNYHHILPMLPISLYMCPYQNIIYCTQYEDFGIFSLSFGDYPRMCRKTLVGQ